MLTQLWCEACNLVGAYIVNSLGQTGTVTEAVSDALAVAIATLPRAVQEPFQQAYAAGLATRHLPPAAAHKRRSAQAFVPVIIERPSVDGADLERMALALRAFAAGRDQIVAVALQSLVDRQTALQLRRVLLSSGS